MLRMKSLLVSAAFFMGFAAQVSAQDLYLDFPLLKLEPEIVRVARYMAVESRHRLTGLASYYSNSLDGTLTANGERYHKRRLTAAHLTLPLGCWVEVTSKTTGRTIRLRVNDRGPYVKKFVIDLSRRAARALGVDVAEDRSVTIRIIALPGDDLLPADVVTSAVLTGNDQTKGTALIGR